MAHSLYRRVIKESFVNPESSSSGGSSSSASFTVRPEPTDLRDSEVPSSAGGRIAKVPSTTTESPPILSTNCHKQQGKRNCTLWVHLQASITTEWEQKSLLLSPSGKFAHKSFESIRRHGETASRNNYKRLLPSSEMDLDVNPKTVHRCILKVSDKPKEVVKSYDLECHVCHWRYPNYDKYFNHLIELHCSRQRVLLKRRSDSATNVCQRKQRRVSTEREEEEAIYLGAQRRTPEEEEEVPPPPEEPKEEVPLNLTSKKRLWLLKEGSQDPVLGSSSIVVDDKELLLSENKDAVRKLSQKLQRTIIFCPETIDDSIYCPHWASRYLPALSVNDNVGDEILLSELRAQITQLLLLVFGEEKLTLELGYPVKDVFEILETASCLYGRIEALHSEREACRRDCRDLNETSYTLTQLKYRLLKRKINTTKKNLLKFIESIPQFYDLS